MRILLIAPSFDANTPGESWSTYKWVQGISERCETVVLTQHKRGWDPAQSPVKARQVVNWDEPRLPGMNGRIAWELKPGYVFFYHRARRWIKAALRRGEHFDLIHQINPLALRYPCPARGLGVPYVIGPLAGSLPTPEAMRASTPEKQWYRKLRSLDSFRLRHDPWLKGSYAGAAAIIGVAPYVEELLGPCAPRRFEIMAETGVESVASTPKTPPQPGEPLRLLFVGRLIRTKGILEAIESVGLASKTHRLTFDIVGTGDLAGECEQLIARLGLGEIVRLHGRQPREEVFRWYDRSHVFLFPSYREPSGNVVFEAMSRGLPVITSSVGGPGYVVTALCGYCIAPQRRDAYVSSLADAITSIAGRPQNLEKMSAAALEHISAIAAWPIKITNLQSLYAKISGKDNVAPPKEQ
jgi:glycosyltransferase involved in cell wall biosynthesis